jgi:hypothetical protein
MLAFSEFSLIAAMSALWSSSRFKNPVCCKILTLSNLVKHSAKLLKPQKWLISGIALCSPQFVVYFGGLAHTLFPCDSQTLSQRYGVFERLNRAIAGCREEGVCSISEAQKAPAPRRPLRRTVAPPQFPVYDTCLCGMDEVQHSRIPFVTRLLQVGNEFRRIFDIRPRFLRAVVVLGKHKSVPRSPARRFWLSSSLTGCVKANATQCGVRKRMRWMSLPRYVRNSGLTSMLLMSDDAGEPSLMFERGNATRAAA